jgi:hypothetical protein
MTEKEILDQLLIDKSKLDTHMSEQPSLYARFAFMSARATDKAERAKLEKKIAESELDTEIRQRQIQKGEKATEKSIEAQIQQEATYKEACEKLLKANLESSILEATVEAFRSRGNMLSSLGAMQRAEMEQQTMMGTPATSRAEAIRDRANAALKQQFSDGVKGRTP